MHTSLIVARGVGIYQTACLLASAFHMVAADTFPQQVKISLVYPRNETYDAAAGVIPVVFSVSNNRYAVPLNPIFFTRLFNYSNYFNTSPLATPPARDLLTISDHDVITSGDTDYLQTQLSTIVGLEGTWLFDYIIRSTYGVVTNPASNTSNTTGSNSSPSLDSHGIIYDTGSFIFTTKKGAGLAPDLVVGTANTSCADVPFTRMLTVTDVLNTPCYSDADVKTCAIIANDTKPVEAEYGYIPQHVNTTTTGSDCGQKLDPSAASAVMASITRLLCDVPPTNGVTCPPPKTFSSPSNTLQNPIQIIVVVVTVVLGVATGALVV